MVEKLIIHAMNPTVPIGTTLNFQLCDEFMRLCMDIYQNRSKFHLLKDKLEAHKRGETTGISDMTIWHLLCNSTTLPITDMNSKFVLDDEICSFDHTLCIGYGFNGLDTYQLIKDDSVSPTRTKALTQSMDGKMYATTVKEPEKEIVRLLSIHYQGRCKKGLSSDAHKLLG